MPPIIDLLSSSPEPQAVKPKSRATVNKPVLKPSTTIKTATVKKSVPSQEVWHILSDDDDTLPQTLPSMPITKEMTNLRSNKSNFLPPLSSDDITFTLPKASNHSRPTLSENTAKRNRDLFYNSDDFDSTVNLDDSSNAIREPITKKPRTSTSNSSVNFTTNTGNQGLGSMDKPPMKSAAYKRSYSNIELGKQHMDIPKMKRSNTAGSKALDLDPLVFTSSPDPHMEAIIKRAKKRKENFSTRQEISMDMLPELSSDTDIFDSKTVPTSKSRQKKFQSEFEKYNAEREKEGKATTKKDGKAKNGVDENDEKAKKASAKESEKEKKLLAKEEKLREKQEKAKEKEKADAIAKVNTLRTDKKISAPEMIVDLSITMDSKLSSQTEAFLEKFKIEHKNWNHSMPVVKFRRKVTAVFNEELGQYEPVAPYIKDEKHIIYVMNAQYFVDLVVSKDEENALDIFFLKLKNQFEGCKIVIMMQGFHTWMRKNKTIQNRQYTQAVRAAGPQAETAPTSSQRKKKDPEYIKEDILEDALLRLQMNHGLLIHHTAVMQETAEQLAVFTQNISLIPYKTQKQPNGTTFCMESGQVKTGSDPADTYVKMLQEMVRVTPSIAYSIIDKYPTVQELAKGLQENGPLDLEDCRKSSNKNGGFTDMRVGPAVSKRVYKVFTGRDPNSLDV